MSQAPPRDPYGQQDPGQYQSRPFHGRPPYQGHSYPGQPLYSGQPYGPPPGQQPHPGSGHRYDRQPPRRRRKRHRVRNILAGIGAVAVAAIAIVAISSYGRGTPAASSASSPASSPAGSPASSPAASPASGPAVGSSSPGARPAKARTVAVFTGSGQKNTPRFTVTSTWKLAYSFSCKRFGQPGDFQVFENGGGDFSGMLVSDLAMSKSASTWENADSGTHYLQIISDCVWTISVVDEQ